MPVITEPKKLSMPQQVQKNKEDIESIFKKIDGLDATDNVVVVPDMSYILSADELKSVHQPVAFIVYDNKLFIKKKEENGNAYFDLVFSIVLSTVISFESEEIEVNLTNGALGITLATVNTYSVSQIDSKFATLTYVNNALGQKANLSGATFTGAITAPSIIENMSGYSFTPSGNLATNNITLTYVGACKNGNKLTLAIFGKITGKSVESNPSIGTFYVPADVAQKIIPDSANYNSVDIKEVDFFQNVYTKTAGKVFAMTKGSGNNLTIQAYRLGETFVDNTDYVFRYEVTFILNDNLIQ